MWTLPRAAYNRFGAMPNSTVAQRLFRAIPLFSLAVIVPGLAWIAWQGGLANVWAFVAVGVFLYTAVVAIVSDHALGRAARARLAKSLGRTVVGGEETSLNTWMRVPSSEIDTATDELEQVALEVERAPVERRKRRR